MDADNDKYWKFLMKLDSNNCKEQDHYKVIKKKEEASSIYISSCIILRLQLNISAYQVLGLSKLRYDATTAEIRHACKLFSSTVLFALPDILCM